MSTKNKSNKPKVVKDLKDITPPAENGAEPETKRPVQTEIPGTERVKIKALDEAGELYVDLRDKMQSAVKAFKERGKTPLIDLMHKNADKLNTTGSGELTYSYSDMVIVLKPAGEQLRVKHVDPEEIAINEAPEDGSEGES